MRRRIFELLFALRLLLDRRYARWVFRLLVSMRKDYLLRARQPWLVFAAIDLLDALDLRGREVFEYGSGGSTLYWLKRGAAVTSIEHDPQWYAKVAALAPAGAALDYRLVQPVRAEAEGDPADPDAYASAEPRWSGLNFREYCRQIDDHSDGSIDIVLIDGRARTSCIKHAARKVKPGGLLIVDNSDRPHYFARTGGYLIDFDRLALTGPVPALADINETSVLTRRKIAG